MSGHQTIENEGKKEIKLLNRKRNLSPKLIIDKQMPTSLSHRDKKEVTKPLISNSIDYNQLINEAFNHFLNGQNDNFLSIQEKLEKYKRTLANNISQ